MNLLPRTASELEKAASASPGTCKGHQSRGWIFLKLDLNVDESTKSGEVIVKMGDVVQVWRDVPHSQMLGATAPAPSASSKASTTPKRPSSSAQTIESALFALRIQFIVSAFTRICHRKILISGGRHVERRKWNSSCSGWNVGFRVGRHGRGLIRRHTGNSRSRRIFQNDSIVAVIEFALIALQTETFFVVISASRTLGWQVRIRFFVLSGSGATRISSAFVGWRRKGSKKYE